MDMFNNKEKPKPLKKDPSKQDNSDEEKEKKNKKIKESSD